MNDGGKHSAPCRNRSPNGATISPERTDQPKCRYTARLFTLMDRLKSRHEPYICFRVTGQAA